MLLNFENSLTLNNPIPLPFVCSRMMVYHSDGVKRVKPNIATLQAKTCSNRRFVYFHEYPTASGIFKQTLLLLCQFLARIPCKGAETDSRANSVRKLVSWFTGVLYFVPWSWPLWPHCRGSPTTIPGYSYIPGYSNIYSRLPFSYRLLFRSTTNYLTHGNTLIYLYLDL
jgi:hypothetical protein